MTRPASVGDNLRHARFDLGLSLADVAQKAGISVATLSRIETDKQNLDVVLLTKLARILGVPPGEMFGPVTDTDRAAVTRRLARLPSKDRARAFSDASRGSGMTVDDLLSMMDVLREELTKLQRSARRGGTR
ncbi:MAG TPA: helix-turn-helix transcriptional regulator [Thermoanaerobaculia bacterium]|nr:helix-turn-helix transcriptional regulator [Thermoanaerobaculia bacterium]